MRQLETVGRRICFKFDDWPWTIAIVELAGGLLYLAAARGSPTMNDISEKLDAIEVQDKLMPVDETCRRAHPRLAGPFEARRIGRLETRVTLYDLSRGGAFINSMYEQQEGTTMTLRIDLPDAGQIAVRALTLYRRPGGYAVRFLEMADEDAKRFDAALRVLQDHGY